MTELLLRAKHWQIFIPLVLPTIISQYASLKMQSGLNKLGEFAAEVDANEELLSGLPPVESFMEEYGLYVWGFVAITVLGAILQFSWYWAVDNRLAQEVPTGTRLNRGVFKGALIVGTVGTLLVSYLMTDLVQQAYVFFTQSVEPNDQFFQEMVVGFGGIMLVGLLMFAATVYAVAHVGKIIRSIEMGRPAPGGEYAGYAILAYLLVIGIWMLQPKLNRYLTTGKMEKEEVRGMV